MIQSSIPWPRLAPAIARALLGQPTRATRRELRYGRKGSLRIDLKAGTFHDFESGRGGGMLDLIQHLKGGDRQSAWHWLETHGMVSARGNRAPPPHAPEPQPERAQPEAPSADRDAQARNAASRLWQKAIWTNTGPLRTYLTGRGCWCPDDPIPALVRWVATEVIQDWHWNPLFPVEAGGGMIVAFTDATSSVAAVQIEALTTTGHRCRPRWRKSRGRIAGSAFRIPGKGPIAVCEGPVDALAIRTWMGCEAWAAGGAGNMAALTHQLIATGRRIEVYADGDPAGRRSAQAIADPVRLAGMACRIHTAGAGADPASELSEAWSERAAIIEANEDCPRRAAEMQAWKILKTDDHGVKGTEG